MIVSGTTINGLYRVQTTVHQDQRGIFYRGFCDHDLADQLQGRTIRQINLSSTKMIGTIRGLHFQAPPHAEMKIIRCVAGAVWDVAVDLRRRSETFLEWFGTVLEPTQAEMLIIPEGFAHGFQVLKPDSQLLYLHTASYYAESEDGIRYNDPRLNIGWPLPMTEISPRDQQHPLLKTDFEGIAL